MFKKIVISTLAVVLLGAVAVGAYDIATGASTLEVPDINLSANAAGNSRGQGQQQGQGRGQGQGQGQSRGQGQGQGQGGNQGGGLAQGQGQNQMTPHEWSTFTGTVVSANAQSLVIDTAEQGQLTLELGPAGFAEQQGVTFTPGDSITGQGFAESGMYHAAEITNETTGASLRLRDPNGRPLWAGGEQGAQSGQGQGQGNGTGVPQAMVNNEWTTVSGTVNSQSQQGLVVDTTDMGQLMLQMGPSWFAAEQGVVFNPGDAVTILGFTGEGATFQAGAITNETTGATLQLRDPNGRPLWAGRGGQGGGGQGQGGGGGQGQGQGGGF